MSSLAANNKTLPVDVLTDAKAIGIKISQVCDQYLRDLVRQEQTKRWKNGNAHFIAVYKQTVAQEELPL